MTWFGCEECTFLKYRHELFCNWKMYKEEVLTGEIRASTEKYWVIGWQCDFPQFKNSISSMTRYVVMSISTFFHRRQMMSKDVPQRKSKWVLLIGLRFPLFSLKSQNSVLAVNSCFSWKKLLETIHGSVSNNLKD